ncbi:MAG TPA: PQQ-binding-like beta-propeller repeat protein [Streptosporangiaceae bacterium]
MGAAGHDGRTAGRHGRAAAGRPGRPLVVALEPRQLRPRQLRPRQLRPRQGAAGGGAGPGTATLVARDARTGRPYWARPVDSTFGPAGCGPYICVSESTARADAHFVALDPATGRARWRIPGVAEVEWSDAGRVVVFRMARRPVLEARDLRTGAAQWSFAVDRAVGHDVDLSGGWDFGALGDIMVGRIGPYQEGRGRLSSFGFFGVRLADGRLVWARPRLLRVYPGAAPAVALVARTVDGRNRYGGFEQLDPGTGRPTVRIPAPATPPTQWWVSFPADLSTIGFLSPGHQGTAYDLRRGTAVPARGRHTWSFCTVSPAPLKIAGQRTSYYPVAPLCAYDLATGRRAATAGAPPGWYTGAADGWRVWRDERGALHARHDARGTAPGMYG